MAKTIFTRRNPGAGRQVTTDTASKKWLSQNEISKTSETLN
jgi:hypothetical protein